jgi:ADP-heptose:LPS heptosyltransferase
VAGDIIIRGGGYAQLAPPTSLTDLAELARRARLFIGSDTGPLHIAAAVGAPCVGLYGPMPARRCGPFGPQHIALQSTSFTGKMKNRRTANNETMRSIGVDAVCEACDAILSRRKTESTVPSDVAFPWHETAPRAMAA